MLRLFSLPQLLLWASPASSVRQWRGAVDILNIVALWVWIQVLSTKGSERSVLMFSLELHPFMVNEKRETERVFQVLTWNPKMRSPFASRDLRSRLIS